LALCLAFFPKLIAGPLVRADRFLTQINEPASLDSNRLMGAFQLLLLGLFKKIVIADSLASLAAVAFRAAHYPNAVDFPAPLYWQGFYLYAIQIYADFSGYTDLARASAMFLGFDLPDNFQQPYLASTLGQFWNRWHMTVTQWFREYLFFPISRAWLKTTDRRYPRAIQIGANLVTMVLIGLWHGAAWTFVAWGLWHGLLLSGERLLNPQPKQRGAFLLSALITLHLVGLGWVLFAAGSFEDALRFVQGMLLGGQWQWLWLYLPPVLLAGGLTLTIDLVAAGYWPQVFTWVKRFRSILIVGACVVLAGLMLLNQVRGADVRPFIYGHF
jgi:D-alanyl-lipoteichoic acid acyltransferase DltB (MBOAT superfamily)